MLVKVLLLRRNLKLKIRLKRKVERRARGDLETPELTETKLLS